MKIFDLTRGKYPQLFYPAINYEKDLKNVIHGCSRFIDMFQPLRADFMSILNEIPIFLVESSMANEYVPIPGCECSVRVPKDKFSRINFKRFIIDAWLNSKEKEIFKNKEDEPLEQTTRGYTTVDLLGVYVSLSNNAPMPKRIFVWMDKVVDYVTKHTKSKAELNNNAKALFELVLYHEFGHALMDIELYGMQPLSYFSYSDYVYRFIEEAYANGVALSTVYEKLPQKQQKFIESFVKNQGPGYSDGWYLGHHQFVDVDQWMAMKVLFNFELALLLREMWKNGNIIPIECFKIVGRDGWLAEKDHNNKWGILDIHTRKMVAGFKKYDYFWSFDENGLCQVRLDQPNGYLYGYINEQGVEQIPVKYDHVCRFFENGITVAKLNGKYGIIDINDHIKAPFNLNYLDMRGLRNGYATMKDYSDKWGAIDAKGNVVVPCMYDTLVFFDDQGIAKVKKDGEEFKIDTSGNRLE